MKYILSSFIVVLFLVTACDKTEISNGQKSTFVKFYGDNTVDEGVKVIQTANGGYLIMGSIKNQNDNQDICIIRTDAYGNSIAPMKTYGGIYDDVGHCIKKDTKGYIIAGYSQQSNLGNKNVYLVQIDDNGNQLWSSNFGSSKDEEAYDIIPLNNGHFALIGYSDSLIDTKKRQILFVETDSVGKPITTSLFGYSANDEEAYSMVKISNGYVVCGYTKSWPVGTTTRNVFIAQIDKSANNYIPMVPPNSEGNSEAISIIRQDSNYVVTCNVQGQLANQYYIQLMKIGPQLDNNHILWKKTLGEKLYTKAGYTTINNSKIYIAGTSATEGTVGNIVLIRTDLQGNNPTYSYIGDGASYSCNSFDFTSDGGYIFTGADHLSEYSVIVLVKVGADLKL